MARSKNFQYLHLLFEGTVPCCFSNRMEQ